MPALSWGIDYQQRMKIRIQSNDQLPPASRKRNDVLVGRAIKANFSHMVNDHAVLSEVLNRAAWQTLIQQQFHHATSNVRI
ncbi:hypothetical protein BDD21_3410 [Thiocapsa rosea]|uniref:Uncharacterized protein n=1 Tax=Thiocapsa rosea TaxID=69360 RepID=A0A495V950_9GAMM|nr:hypothetical protein BDD21_3410 [Thiocapsa rosea]